MEIYIIQGCKVHFAMLHLKATVVVSLIHCPTTKGNGLATDSLSTVPRTLNGISFFFVNGYSNAFEQGCI